MSHFWVFLIVTMFALPIGYLTLGNGEGTSGIVSSGLFAIALGVVAAALFGTRRPTNSSRND